MSDGKECSCNCGANYCILCNPDANLRNETPSSNFSSIPRPVNSKNVMLRPATTCRAARPAPSAIPRPKRPSSTTTPFRSPCPKCANKVAEINRLHEMQIDAKNSSSIKTKCSAVEYYSNRPPLSYERDLGRYQTKFSTEDVPDENAQRMPSEKFPLGFLCECRKCYCEYCKDENIQPSLPSREDICVARTCSIVRQQVSEETIQRDKFDISSEKGDKIGPKRVLPVAQRSSFRLFPLGFDCKCSKCICMSCYDEKKKGRKPSFEAEKIPEVAVEIIKGEEVVIETEKFDITITQETEEGAIIEEEGKVEIDIGEPEILPKDELVITEEGKKSGMEVAEAIAPPQEEIPVATAEEGKKSGIEVAEAIAPPQEEIPVATAEEEKPGVEIAEAVAPLQEQIPVATEEEEKVEQPEVEPVAPAPKEAIEELEILVEERPPVKSEEGIEDVLVKEEEEKPVISIEKIAVEIEEEKVVSALEEEQEIPVVEEVMEKTTEEEKVETGEEITKEIVEEETDILVPKPTEEEELKVPSVYFPPVVKEKAEQVEEGQFVICGGKYEVFTSTGTSLCGQCEELCKLCMDILMKHKAAEENECVEELKMEEEAEKIMEDVQQPMVQKEQEFVEKIEEKFVEHIEAVESPMKEKEIEIAENIEEKFVEQIQAVESPMKETEIEFAENIEEKFVEHVKAIEQPMELVEEREVVQQVSETLEQANIGEPKESGEVEELVKVVELGEHELSEQGEEQQMSIHKVDTEIIQMESRGKMPPVEEPHLLPSERELHEDIERDERLERKIVSDIQKSKVEEKGVECVQSCGRGKRQKETRKHSREKKSRDVQSKCDEVCKRSKSKKRHLEKSDYSHEIKSRNVGLQKETKRRIKHPRSKETQIGDRRDNGEKEVAELQECELEETEVEQGDTKQTDSAPKQEGQIPEPEDEKIKKDQFDSSQKNIEIPNDLLNACQKCCLRKQDAQSQICYKDAETQTETYIANQNDEIQKDQSDPCQKCCYSKQEQCDANQLQSCQGVLEDAEDQEEIHLQGVLKTVVMKQDPCDANRIHPQEIVLQGVLKNVAQKVPCDANRKDSGPQQEIVVQGVLKNLAAQKDICDANRKESGPQQEIVLQGVLKNLAAQKDICDANRKESGPQQEIALQGVLKNAAVQKDSCDANRRDSGPKQEVVLQGVLKNVAAQKEICDANRKESGPQQEIVLQGVLKNAVVQKVSCDANKRESGPKQEIVLQGVLKNMAVQKDSCDANKRNSGPQQEIVIQGVLKNAAVQKDSCVANKKDTGPQQEIVLQGVLKNVAVQKSICDASKGDSGSKQVIHLQGVLKNVVTQKDSCGANQSSTARILPQSQQSLKDVEIQKDQTDNSQKGGSQSRVSVQEMKIEQNQDDNEKKEKSPEPKAQAFEFVKDVGVQEDQNAHEKKPSSLKRKSQFPESVLDSTIPENQSIGDKRESLPKRKSQFHESVKEKQLSQYDTDWRVKSIKEPQLPKIFQDVETPQTVYNTDQKDNTSRRKSAFRESVQYIEIDRNHSNDDWRVESSIQKSQFRESLKDANTAMDNNQHCEQGEQTSGKGDERKTQASITNVEQRKECFAKCADKLIDKTQCDLHVDCKAACSYRRCRSPCSHGKHSQQNVGSEIQSEGRDGRDYRDRPRSEGRSGRGYDSRRGPEGKSERGYDDRPGSAGKGGRGYDDRPRSEGRGYDDRPGSAGKGGRGYDDRPRSEGRGYDDRPGSAGKGGRGYDDRPRSDGRGYDDRPGSAEKGGRGYDDRPRSEGRGYDDRPGSPGKGGRGYDDRRADEEFEEMSFDGRQQYGDQGSQATPRMSILRNREDETVSRKSRASRVSYFEEMFSGIISTDDAPQCAEGCTALCSGYYDDIRKSRQGSIAAYCPCKAEGVMCAEKPKRSKATQQPPEKSNKGTESSERLRKQEGTESSERLRKQEGIESSERLRKQKDELGREYHQTPSWSAMNQQASTVRTPCKSCCDGCAGIIQQFTPKSCNCKEEVKQNKPCSASKCAKLPQRTQNTQTNNDASSQTVIERRESKEHQFQSCKCPTNIRNSQEEQGDKYEDIKRTKSIEKEDETCKCPSCRCPSKNRNSQEEQNDKHENIKRMKSTEKQDQSCKCQLCKDEETDHLESSGMQGKSCNKSKCPGSKQTIKKTQLNKGGKIKQPKPIEQQEKNCNKPKCPGNKKNTQKLEVDKDEEETQPELIEEKDAENQLLTQIEEVEDSSDKKKGVTIDTAMKCKGTYNKCQKKSS